MPARVPPPPPPPLVGYNNNVRYRGVTFHIQTEDSGIARPHVITHLFVDGGRVIRTLRTDYAEHVASPDGRAIVQRLMREQHRTMAQDLRKGRLDAVIDGLGLEPPPDPRRRTSKPKLASAALRSEQNPGELAHGEAEAKPKRRKTPRSRAALEVPVEPEPAAIFGGAPRESLDDLILGYIDSTIG